MSNEIERAADLVEGLADAAPGATNLEPAQAFARAALAAEIARGEVGFLRDEHLDQLMRLADGLATQEAGWSRSNVLATLASVDLDTLADTLGEHMRDADGAAEVREALRRRHETAEFDHRHRANFVFHGTPAHEGRYDGSVWRNWAEDYEATPARFVKPRTEAELCAAVAAAKEARVVGAGHSFNAGTLSPDTMISLDDYGRVLSVDTKAKTARVQAGIRLRDLNKALDAAGLGLPVLGSTDPQAIGGLLATDLHGTGRTHGYLSSQVISARVVDGRGNARTVRAGDPLFHAVFGAVGVCGVVAEVELQLVDAFRLEKVAELVDYDATADGIDALLAAHDHVSFYCIGGGERSRSMQMHTWDRTDAPLTDGWERKKRRAELADFELSAFAPGLTKLAAAMDADRAQAISPRKALVLPGSRAFGRKLYYRHDELEAAVPFAHWRACLDEVIDVHRRLGAFSVIEVRFTPEPSPALLRAHDGPSCHIGLATPLSLDRGELYPAVEEVLFRHHGHPHLGKQTFATAHDLRRVYGESFDRFQAVRAEQDPDGTFLNEFTSRLFGPI